MYHYKARVGNFFHAEWPILARPTGFFVLLGLALFLRYFKHRAAFVMILMFLFGLLPAILSEPDAARSLMTTIPICAFAATGIASLVRLIPTTLPNRWKKITFILLVFWISASEFNFYFNRLGIDFYAQFGYARKHTLIGEKGLELAKNNEIYISQGHFIDTPKFICYSVPGDVFAITDGDVLGMIPDRQLIANVNRILSETRQPGKGLAFILENEPKNEMIFDLIKQKYSEGVLDYHYDQYYGDEPIFYTYVIPRNRMQY